jgi:Carboxypeptidase regulatory-like domain
MNKVFSILLALTFVSGTAWASTSSFQGIVKDPKGRIIPGAVIRVEKDGKLLAKAKTDADGHYVTAPVAPGMYQVALVIDSTLIATYTNAKTKTAGPTDLNFSLQDKRFWVQDAGSNVRRSVDPNDPNALVPDHQVLKAGSEYLQRMQDRTAGAER